jgi:hypothetical protein
MYHRFVAPMKTLANYLLALIFIISCLTQPYAANAKLNECSTCCKQTTCSCVINDGSLSEQSLRNSAVDVKTGRGNLKQCSNCIPQQNKEDPPLLTGSFPESKKKSFLFFDKDALPVHTSVLNKNGALLSAIDYPFISSLSLFLINDCLRL